MRCLASTHDYSSRHRSRRLWSAPLREPYSNCNEKAAACGRFGLHRVYGKPLLVRTAGDPADKACERFGVQVRNREPAHPRSRRVRGVEPAHRARRRWRRSAGFGTNENIDRVVAIAIHQRGRAAGGCILARPGLAPPAPRNPRLRARSAPMCRQSRRGPWRHILPARHSEANATGRLRCGPPNVSALSWANLRSAHAARAEP